MFGKIRCTYKDSVMYIDVYHNKKSKVNNLFCSIIGFSGWNQGLNGTKEVNKEPTTGTTEIGSITLPTSS